MPAFSCSCFLFLYLWVVYGTDEKGCWNVFCPIQNCSCCAGTTSGAGASTTRGNTTWVDGGIIKEVLGSTVADIVFLCFNFTVPAVSGGLWNWWASVFPVGSWTGFSTADGSFTVAVGDGCANLMPWFRTSLSCNFPRLLYLQIIKLCVSKYTWKPWALYYLWTTNNLLFFVCSRQQYFIHAEIMPHNFIERKTKVASIC